MDKLEQHILDQYTYLRECACEGMEDACSIGVKVGHQAFCLSGAQERDVAEAMRQWVAQALARMVRECNGSQ